MWPFTRKPAKIFSLVRMTRSIPTVILPLFRYFLFIRPLFFFALTLILRILHWKRYLAFNVTFFRISMKIKCGSVRILHGILFRFLLYFNVFTTRLYVHMWPFTRKPAKIFFLTILVQNLMRMTRSILMWRPLNFSVYSMSLKSMNRYVSPTVTYFFLPPYLHLPRSFCVPYVQMSK